MADASPPDRPSVSFTRELAALLNRHNWDTATNTPDFVLARHIAQTLTTLAGTIHRREALIRRDTPEPPP